MSSPTDLHSLMVTAPDTTTTSPPPSAIELRFLIPASPFQKSHTTLPSEDVRALYTALVEDTGCLPSLLSGDPILTPRDGLVSNTFESDRILTFVTDTLIGKNVSFENQTEAVNFMVNAWRGSELELPISELEAVRETTAWLGTMDAEWRRDRIGNLSEAMRDARSQEKETEEVERDGEDPKGHSGSMKRRRDGRTAAAATLLLGGAAIASLWYLKSQRGGDVQVT